MDWLPLTEDVVGKVAHYTTRREATRRGQHGIRRRLPAIARRRLGIYRRIRRGTLVIPPRRLISTRALMPHPASAREPRHSRQRQHAHRRLPLAASRGLDVVPPPILLGPVRHPQRRCGAGPAGLYVCGGGDGVRGVGVWVPRRRGAQALVRRGLVGRVRGGGPWRW